VPDDPPAAGKVSRDVDQLSPRQREIALAAASALSNKELAAQFNISLGTLKLHLSTIYGRLGLEGRRALMLYVLDRRQAA
jgi:DNA-binding NarL/FixJ family response regulator